MIPPTPRHHEIEPDGGDAALLEDVCQTAGCYLPNGDHAAEQVTACLERWLNAREEREMQP